jgi:hypothetical protein
VDKTPVVPFAHVWTDLLALPGTPLKLELDNHEVAQLLDMCGLDYIVRLDDNKLLACAYRCLRWQGWDTLTFRDKGRERLSEWDRLWLDSARYWKPQFYVICYHDDRGAPMKARAIATADLVGQIDRELASTQRNGTDHTAFRYVHAWTLSHGLIRWDDEGGES